MEPDSKRPKVEGRRLQIAILGSLNYDLVTTTSRVPSAGETITALSFATNPGGKGANQAVACARATRSKPQPIPDALSSKSILQTHRRENGEVDVSMYGGVGPDDYGEKLRSTLAENEIDAEHVLTAPEGVSTGIATVLVEESGENRILVVPGANAWLAETALRNQVFDDEPDLLVMQGEIPMEMTSWTILSARQMGRDVLWNPAPVPPLAEYNELRMDECFKDLAHLIVNEYEAGMLSQRLGGEVNGEVEQDGEMDEARLETAFTTFAKAGVKNTVITLGSRGAAWRGEDGKVRKVEAVKGVKAVDTTAAGDTFVGYYAAGIVEAKRNGEEPDFEKIIERANRAAALSVTRQGAISSIPWRDELEESNS